MGRRRSTMAVVLDVLKSQSLPISSENIAAAGGLELQQTRDALKTLSHRKEVNRLKDPATTRGFLYLPVLPPAYTFVNPDDYGAPGASPCAVAWMRQQLLPEVCDFSILMGDIQNRAKFSLEQVDAEAL